MQTLKKIGCCSASVMLALSMFTFGMPIANADDAQTTQSATSASAADADSTSSTNSGTNATTEKLSLKKTTTLSGGGKKYTYGLDSDSDSSASEKEAVMCSCLVPPDGFDPLTASDSELEEYGFPQKPTDDDELAAWKEAMSAWKKSTTSSATVTIEKSSTDTDSTMAASSIVKHCSFNNWSGFAAAGPDNTFKGVSGVYYQPLIAKDTSYDTYSCYWVGLGGLDNGSLLQCGTIADYDASSNTRDCRAWYEWLSDDGDKINMTPYDSFDVSHGDKIYAECHYVKSTKTVTLYVEDETTGESRTEKKQFSTNDCYNGCTAEWIVERQKVSGELLALSNYDTCTWKNCHALATADTSNPDYETYKLGNLDRWKIYMYSTDWDRLLSSPNTITDDDNFTTTWHAYK